MKRMIISSALLLVTSGFAFANPLFLTFRSVDGSECSFDASSLSMTVADGKLLVSNSEKSAELNLSTLVSMRFTDNEASKIEEAVNIASVEVFSLKGERLGLYKSNSEASKALPAGTYIFKSGEKTEKKIIK